MATLIVETGSNVPNANSYVSLAEASGYSATYGYEDWPATDDTAATNSLIKATRAIDLLYGDKYMSHPYSNVQALLWPRGAFYTIDGSFVGNNVIPKQLKDAVIILANMDALGQDILALPNPDSFTTDSTIKIDVISISSKYLKPVTREPTYIIDLTLRPIIKAKSIARFVL